MSLKQHLKYHATNLSAVVRKIHGGDSLHIQSEPPIDHKKFQSGCGCAPFWIIVSLVALFIISVAVSHEEWEKVSRKSRNGTTGEVFFGEKHLLEFNRFILIILILFWMATLPGKDQNSTLASIAAAVVAILLTFICSHFLPYTYDPYLYEEEWQLTRQISKSNGIEVIKSRAFEIVLKNTGEQPWRSKGGFVVRRSSEVYHSRWKTIIPIPRDIFLLPGKTTTLIPYTETYPHGAVKVHDFRCFGYDKGDWVRTVVKEADPNQKVALGQLDEQFEHLGPGQQWLEINETLVTGEGEQTVKLL